MPTVVINPATGEAMSLDDASAHAALQKGQAHVPLVDAQGNATSAPMQDAMGMLSAGTHRQPSVGQLQDMLDATHYQKPGQQALALMEGALEPLSAGTYGKLAASTGLTTEKDVLKRAEQNPGTHILGEVGGAIGGSALAPETSIPGMISGLGGGAAEAVGGGLLGHLAGGAVEGALLAAPHEINESLLGDPNATAQNITANIGMSAALGGGLGLALSPIASMFSSTKNLGKRALGIAASESGAPVETSLERILPTTGMAPEEIEAAQKGLKELKPWADELQMRSDRAGLPIQDEMLSNSEFVRKLGSGIAQEPTLIGIAKRAKYNQGFQQAESLVRDALGPDINLSNAEAGTQISNSLESRLSQEASPLAAQADALRASQGNVPVDRGHLNDAIDKLGSIDGYYSSSGAPLNGSDPGYKLISQVQEGLQSGRLPTVDDVNAFNSSIQKSIPKLATPSEKYAAGEIKSVLSDLKNNSLLQYAKASGNISEDEAANIINQQKSFNKAYGTLKGKLDDLGGALGIKTGPGYGIQSFLDKLHDMPPEAIAKKLFTKENSGALKTLQDNFPEAAQTLFGLQKSSLLKDATSGATGVLNTKGILSKINDLEPEVKKLLFSPEQMEKLEDAHMWLQNLPEKLGPSGTPEGTALMDWLKHPLAIPAAHAADFVKSQLIKALVHSPSDGPMLTTLSHIALLSSKTAHAVQKEATGIFGALGGRALTQDAEYKRRKEEKINSQKPVLNRAIMAGLSNVNNPDFTEKMINTLSPVSDRAPQVATAIAHNIATSASFLQSKLPVTQKMSPFDSDTKPPASEIAKFNRYAEIVDNPMGIMQHIKDGTLLPQDMEAIQTTHPDLYDQMKSAIMDKLVSHLSKHEPQSIPYKTRIAMGMFLGQNLDSTMTQQGLMANQSAIMMNNVAQKQQQASQQARPSKAGMREMKSIQSDSTRFQQTLSRRQT